jgi:hypothetical protein
VTDESASVVVAVDTGARPTLVAVVVSYVAWQQWRTARHRLRFDLFEKRAAVYEATKEIITVQLHGHITREELGEFFGAVRGAEFLFDGDTRDFLEKIARMGFRARMASFASERHEHKPELVDEVEDILEFLQQQGPHLEKLFAKYLDLSKVGL